MNKLSSFRSTSRRQDTSCGRVTVQVFVSNASYAKYMKTDAEVPQKHMTDYIASPLRLTHATHEYITEAGVRAFPELFGQPSNATCAHADNEHLIAVWLCLCPDRAQVNFLVAVTLCVIVAASNERVLTHVEFCNIHGAMLAKFRSSQFRKVQLSISGLTRWFQLGRNVDALEVALKKTISACSFEWHPEGIPPVELEIIEDIKTQLFVNDGALWNSKEQSDGTCLRVKSSLHLSLDALLQCVLFGEDRLVHYCEPASSSTPMGGRVGANESANESAVCCRTIDDARMKVVQTILRWLTSRSWVVASDNRWTSQPASNRRILIAELANRVLTQCLQNVHREWGLHKQFHGRCDVEGIGIRWRSSCSKE